jgi:hypothetical protein
LEDGGIIIMGIASYHSVTPNKVPNTSAKNNFSSIGWNRKEFVFQKQKQELRF